MVVEYVIKGRFALVGFFFLSFSSFGRGKIGKTTERKKKTFKGPPDFKKKKKHFFSLFTGNADDGIEMFCFVISVDSSALTIENIGEKGVGRRRQLPPQNTKSTLVE